jgi:hypothetical protein
MAGLVQTFYDYALLARYFREAHVAELEQVSGARQNFFVVPMPGASRRKQLMYDLTSRIVDADSLPVNLIIVSNWARTGWNVIRPNLLLDATATHDVTAWQQLRGRAIRAWHSWTNDCYRLSTVLMGHHLISSEDDDAEQEAGEDGQLDDGLLALLEGIAPPKQRKLLAAEGADALSERQRVNLTVSLARGRNKVTIFTRW